VLLSAEFNKRFIALDASILWAALLDPPRFNLKGWHWEDDNKDSKSKKFFIQEVLTLALSEKMVHVDLTGRSDVSSSDDCNSDVSFDFLFVVRNVRRSSIDSQDKELSCIEILKVEKNGAHIRECVIDILIQRDE
jgi:hypothetical protein